MPHQENDYPRICAEVGLSCEECTESTARESARACKGLRGKMVAQLFVQIHSYPACLRMHAHFARAYHEASAVQIPLAIAAVA